MTPHVVHELDGVPLTHHAVGPLPLHVVEAGPADGTPVLLLHGFPEWWYGWRKQIPALARAGYRVLAPDQRGYARSGRPASVSAYTMPVLMQDVLVLLTELGVNTPIHLVGHDWGGAVAYAFATAHAERVRCLTVLNCPHPRALRAALTSNPHQLARSWYMAAFQVPWLPERALHGGKARSALAETSAPGTFTEEELDLYQAEVWATPEHCRGPLNWYRAARLGGFPPGKVRAPTRLIWGTADHALGAELVEPTLARCDDGHCVPIEGASHWVAAEAPDAVSAALFPWLLDHGGPDPLSYKIVPATTWEAVTDAWDGSAADRADGFIHLSSQHQLADTLERHYAGQKDLLILGVEPSRLPLRALRWEPSRGGARFPHLYGPLPRAAVVSASPHPATATP